jgi:hypothetical protein
MRKLKYRLIACYRILFCKYKHWAILWLSEEDLSNLIEEKPFNVDITYHGLQPYNYKSLIKNIADSYDEIELICDKAKYEADAINYKNKNQ